MLENSRLVFSRRWGGVERYGCDYSGVECSLRRGGLASVVETASGGDRFDDCVVGAGDYGFVVDVVGGRSRIWRGTSTSGIPNCVEDTAVRLCLRSW